ncbi:cancer-associated gene 1 protein isoform X1 [Myotis daubentonii]|uniref:cancer-associated gene 1 protein isoform X1 n=2 Tax=Myotis daubentonii TaxID=98922 RepID=UPI002873AF9D|nr:cancer-associated gene 1 protein isoform X1 [Myotis daubentonii]XP_059544530.1 cancer-associated gene 1 protein isoform X1 [Myotis daubentonii]XP_059544531.1 cancer-associated gene 1 protein isoform X1 [Myotis daubentonii]XP_059544533.1 cancer-associated gene 1 protein isoform X1 [Myotis daubentonii]XP_059544534.1 cancer-associated gene 1 protein isoform X1 [Myotis daubentonii]
MDVSHEKLESMSEVDAMNFTSLSQDLTHSNSPSCMETSNTTSDLSQNEIKNVKKENESKITLSEEIYSTLDDVLGDVNSGNYSQDMLTRPIDTSISSFRQCEPIFKYHQTKAFNDKMLTFQNLIGNLPYTEKPELQSHVYNYAKDNNIKEDSFKEENPVGTSTSTNEDQLSHECEWQPPRSPSEIHCSRETLKFIEMPLAENTAKESTLNSGQPENLCKEYLYNNVEKPFYQENSFNLYDLRADYETKEVAVSSKGIQNSRDTPEMSVSHQKEVTVENMESPGIMSTHSPAGISWSCGASWEDCKTHDTEQDLECLQPLEEDMALNEVLQKLKHTNKKQQTLIQNLQCTNMYLEKKVEELQVKTNKQQVCIGFINKLKENIEALIEDKYSVMLEKNETDKTLQNLHDILTNTQRHLQESRKEKETLQVELKRTKENYVCLKEKYITEMQEKNKIVSQYTEVNKALSKKEEEVERLQQLRGELENATTSALDLLKREKETQEQEFLSLQEEFQKREKEYLEERQKLKCRLEKLVAQLKNVQFISESERAKNTKLEQQINEVKNENAKLQQQVARSEEQNCFPKFEIAQLKEHLEAVMKSDITKDAKIMQSNCSPCKEESPNPPDVKTTSQPPFKIHYLLALMASLLTSQDISNPDAEHFKESEKVSDTMLQKLKNFHLKKKNLDEEVTDFDSNETKNVRDPTLLGAKLDKYHSLNEELNILIEKLGNLLEFKEDHCTRLIEENDKYQRHLGNLINKVTSYEEIIECADQRLKISRSQIAQPRRLEYHLKSMPEMSDISEGNGNDLD